MPLSLDPAHGPVPRSRIFAVLGVIILLSEIATFEIIMVLPDLPHLAREFRTLNIAWAVSIVTLAGATVQPLVGKASDKWGKKRVLMVMAGVFVLGSIVCALAPNFEALLLGRALQGGLVGVVTISYSLVRDIMPRDFVPIALGTVVTGIGMSAVAGPFIAGWIIDGFGPRGIFWFMALYVVVLLPIYAAVVPESDVRVHRPVDYLGVILLGPGIAILLLAVTKGGTWGWATPRTLGLFALGIVMLVGFVAWQRVTANPLIDLKVLLGPRFGPTVLAVGCISYMMNAHSVISPTLLETPAMPGISYGAGLSATSYALWTFPLGVVAMFVGPLGGYLAKRIGARPILIASGVLFLVVMLVSTQLLTLQWQIALVSTTAGFAVGFLHSSNANLVQDALPASQGGVGNSIGGMIALLAGGIAATLTGVMMSHHVLAVDATTHSVVYQDAGLRNAYLLSACVGVVGVVVAILMKHGRTPAQGGLIEEVDLSTDPTRSVSVTPR